MTKFVRKRETSTCGVIIAVQYDEGDVVGMLNQDSCGAIAEWFDGDVDPVVALGQPNEITDSGAC